MRVCPQRKCLIGTPVHTHTDTHTHTSRTPLLCSVDDAHGVAAGPPLCPEGGVVWAGSAGSPERDQLEPDGAGSPAPSGLAPHLVLHKERGECYFSFTHLTCTCTLTHHTYSHTTHTHHIHTHSHAHSHTTHTHHIHTHSHTAVYREGSSRDT